MLLNFHPFYAADGGGASSDEDDDPDERVRSEDIINRSSNAQDTIARLGRELDRNETRRFNLRTERRTLRDQVAAAALPNGARVLTKDEAAAYDAYTALGKPDELRQAIAEREATTTELATLRRKQSLHDVQAITGYDPDVLGEIGPNWQSTTKDEQADGQPVKVVYVKEGDAEQRIEQHPKVQKYLGALKPATAQPTGTGYVTQSTGDKQPPQNAAQAYINQRYKGAT
jgi:hypothetical protein